MTTDRLVCPRCGESDRFQEDVEISATRGMKLVVGDDGKAKFEPDYGSETFYDERHDVRSNSSFVECACGAQFQGADELRVVWNDWQPGDLVIAPDGLRGVIDRVCERRIGAGPKVRQFLTLVGWHEEFESWHLTPLFPTTARSEPLLPA